MKSPFPPLYQRGQRAAEWQLYTPPPKPPCRPSSLHGLCSQREGTTEEDSRPQSGWAKSTTTACLLACLHIVETSVIKGIPIFIPTEFLLQTAVLVYKVIGILLVNKIVDLQDLKIKKNKNSTGNLF